VSSFLSLRSLAWDRRQWLAFLLVLSSVTAVSVAYVVLSPRTYRVEAILAPVEKDEVSAAIGGLSAPLSSLAALVGTPSGGSSEVAIAMLTGREFTEDFVRTRNLLPRLFPERWNARTNSWSGEAPTPADAYHRITDDGVRTVLRDRKSGLITLRLEHVDRELIAEMATGMVSQVNKNLRAIETREATRSVEFLTSELEREPQVEIRESINRLIEAQLKRRMLASVRPDFALRTVDFAGSPPASDYVWPRPVLIVGFALCVGAGVAAAVASILTPRNR
jgi:uncharacterized protein involved in exopolysaccharide biosynthesis